MSVPFKGWVKILSCFLCCVLFFQTVQVAVFAVEFDSDGDVEEETAVISETENENDEILPEAPEILSESYSKREETVKHFNMSDGTILAAQYNVPVHFKSGDAFVDYDNTLIENDKEYVNKAADYRVHLSKTSGENELIQYEKDGYQLSWYYAEENTVDLEVINPGKDDGDPTTLEKLYSSAKYKNIFDNTDIEFIFAPNCVKDNLILNGIESKSSYTVFYNANGLKPVLINDKTVEIQNETGEAVFVVYAPYMIDANGTVSTDLALSVFEMENGLFSLEIALNEAWLNEPDRAFPVTVDPMLQVKQEWTDATHSQSAFIASDTPNAQYGRGGNSYTGSLYVGKVSGLGKTRSLIQNPTLPTLGIADKVVHAELSVRTYESNPLRVDLRRVTSAWTESTVCWNTGINYDSAIADYQMVQFMTRNDTNADRWQLFEITELVKGWYSGEYENHGVILITDNEISDSLYDCAWFLGSGYPQLISVRPQLLIEYQNMSGYEDYWSYTSLDAGRGGIVSVNNYNGNLVFKQPLTNDNGGFLMPVNISLVYNSNQKEVKTTGFASHMNINYGIKLFEETDQSLTANGYRYYLRDEDGTIHWFKFENSSDNTAKDEDGLGYTLEVPSSSNTNLYSVKDKDENEMIFDAGKDLIEIKDKIGNSINITYEPVNNTKRIKTITDGANRAYEFHYDANDRCDYILDPAQNKTEFVYYIGSYVVLSRIIFHSGTDEERRIVLYYNAGNITKILAQDDTKVNIDYGTDSQKRVQSINYCGTNDAILEQYNFDYQQNETTVSQLNHGSYKYQFNDMGQITGIVSSDEQIAQYYQWNAGNSTSAKANKLLSESKVISSTKNYVRDPGFTSALSSNYYFWSASDTGSPYAVIDSEKGFFTKNAVKVYKPSENTGSVLICQNLNTLSTGKTYTASAYVNTNGAEIPGNGIYFAIQLREGSSIVKTIKCEKKTKTTQSGWARVFCTFVLPANTTARLYAGFYSNSNGTVWFDDLQVEEGYGVTSCNLIQNSGLFINKSGWTGGTRETSSAFLLAGYPAYLRVTGNAESSTLGVSQTVNTVAGSKGAVFSFGSWVKADSAPVNELRGNDSCKPEFSVILHFYNSAGTSVGKQEIQANCDITSWQFVSGKAIAPAAYDYVKLEIDYHHNVNYMCMVGAFLYKEEFGETYTYDNDGNIKSMVDVTKSQSTFAYQDNQIAKMLNPSGSRYVYSYDKDKNTLKNALSTDGLQYQFSYDTNGEPLSATLSERKLASSIISGKSYYIVNAESGNCMDTTDSDYVKNYRFDPTKNAQKWQAIATGETGVFYLKSPAHGGWYLKVSQNSNTNNCSMVAESGTGDAAMFKPVFNSTDGTFTIQTKTSNFEKVIDGQASANTDYSDGSAIKQCNAVSGDQSQKWLFFECDTSSQKEIQTSATYSVSKNYLKTTTDAIGNTTTYTHITNTGVLHSQEDAMHNTTGYSYNESNHPTTITGPAVAGGQPTIQYSYYDDDRLSSINASNITNYYFDYDSFRRKSNVSVGNGTTQQSLASYSYNAKNLLSQMTYGNGATQNISYNELDKITQIDYNNSSTRKAEYFYGTDGNQSMLVDYSANIRQIPVYDLSGRLISTREYTGTNIEENNLRLAVNVTYANKTNYITKKAYTMPTTNWNVSYTYGTFSNGQMPDQVYNITYSSGYKTDYAYDQLGRRTTETVKYGTNTIGTNSYTYQDRADNTNLTSTQVSAFSTLSGTYSYTYDGNGNITQISFAPADGGSAKVTCYEYDALNRLTREDNPFTNKTYKFEYDRNGNITNKKTYSYTTGTLPSSATSTIVYSYGDATWRDKLTKYGSTTITYDAIGNPTNIGGNVLHWTGRMLDSYTDASNLCEYTYDVNGQRYSKTVNDETTEYYYADGQLVAQVCNGERLTFRYDEAGSPVSVYYTSNAGNRAYWYVKNLQGDIVAITNSAGTIVATYTYDAWGKLRASTDTDSLHIGTINPLRYRGYYYDTETGFYYLNSRYYSPTWGRFINADSLTGANQDLQSYNLFAYCSNNPVNYLDPSGAGIFGNIIEKVIKPSVKWVAKEIIRPSLTFAKRILNKINFTHTLGISVSGAFGVRGTGSIGLASDTKGNVGLVLNGGVGGGTPMYSVGFFRSSTNAPDIYSLRKDSVNIGGSLSYKGLGVGLDCSLFFDPKDNSPYWGISKNIGLKGSPFIEFHGDGQYTYVIKICNIFDCAYAVLDAIDEWGNG